MKFNDDPETLLKSSTQGKCRRGPTAKFTRKLAEKTYLLAKKGLTDKETAEVIDVSEVTITRWKQSEGYKNALKHCKEHIDKKVEQALLTRALGYEYSEEHATKKGIAELRKKMHPDVTACLAWLNNRQPDRWRYRKDKEDTSVNVNLSVSVKNLVKEINKECEQFPTIDLNQELGQDLSQYNGSRSHN